MTNQTRIRTNAQLRDSNRLLRRKCRIQFLKRKIQHSTVTFIDSRHKDMVLLTVVFNALNLVIPPWNARTLEMLPDKCICYILYLYYNANRMDSIVHKTCIKFVLIFPKYMNKIVQYPFWQFGVSQ